MLALFGFLLCNPVKISLLPKLQVPKCSCGLYGTSVKLLSQTTLLAAAEAPVSMLSLLKRHLYTWLFWKHALINVLPPLIQARLNPFQLRKCFFVVPCNSSPTSLVFSRQSSSLSSGGGDTDKALEDRFIPNSLWSTRKAATLDIGQKQHSLRQEFHLVTSF